MQQCIFQRFAKVFPWSDNTRAAEYKIEMVIL